MYHPDDLKEMRLKYLRENQRKEYHRLRQEGELEKHLEFRANRCIQRAGEILASRATDIESQAWSWAIREVLLGHTLGLSVSNQEEVADGRWSHRPPSHNSKMVLSTVNDGGR